MHSQFEVVFDRTAEAAAAVDRNVWTAIVETATAIKEGAARNAPHGATGKLARSYKTEEHHAERMAEIGSDIKVTGNRPVARWQEHGTVKMGAHPHLEPAARSEESKHHERVVKAVNRAT